MGKIKDIRNRTPRSNGTRKESSITNIARHHSATPTGNFDTFWRSWSKDRGWGTGGYHEIILRDGSTEICYDPHEITNGVANHNSKVYNICLVGNGSFTVAQEKAFKERALIAMKRFGLPASAVKGHNEFSGTSTGCPGINMDIIRDSLKGNVGTSGGVVDPYKKGYLFLNDKGTFVGVTQKNLNRVLGTNLDVDDIYGEATKAAVIRFQKSNGLKPDGIYGKDSDAKMVAILNKLDNEAAKPVVKPKPPVESAENKRDTPSPWAKVAVDKAVELKYTDGSNLKGNMTREEGITIIMRALGLAPKIE